MQQQAPGEGALPPCVPRLQPADANTALPPPATSAPAPDDHAPRDRQSAPLNVVVEKSGHAAQYRGGFLRRRAPDGHGDRKGDGGLCPGPLRRNTASVSALPLPPTACCSDDENIEYYQPRTWPTAVLSLDGRKEVNDDLRPTVNGKGSYDVIVPKFQKLIAGRGTNKDYYLRGTFTRFHQDFCRGC